VKRALDERLCTTYPELFRDRHKPMTETAMCWGFACGDGWYPLIDRLCRMLTADLRYAQSQLNHTENAYAKLQTTMEHLPEHERVYLESSRAHYTPETIEAHRAEVARLQQSVPVVAQVKEKFGGLRFYVDGGTEKHWAYIRFAEAMSYSICEECGATRNVSQTVGWIRTICVPCATEHNLLHELRYVPSDDIADVESDNE
jgi:hypothetical protein